SCARGSRHSASAVRLLEAASTLNEIGDRHFVDDAAVFAKAMFRTRPAKRSKPLTLPAESRRKTMETPFGPSNSSRTVGFKTAGSSQLVAKVSFPSLMAKRYVASSSL